MVEAFYRTAVTKDQENTAEYYALSLTHLTGTFFVVAEHHGWWDDKEKKARLNTRILSTAQEPTNEAEAWRLYKEQRAYLVRQGYVHVYQRDYMSGDHSHEVLG